MNPAHNLVLVGPMGAGKTSLGRHIAGRFGLSFVDTDREIEACTGASVATIFACEGEAGFRARERAVLARLLSRRNLAIATGGGAVLDPDNRRLIRSAGFVVFLDVDIERQLARLARDRSRPLLAGTDREQVLQQLAHERRPLYEQVADLRFKSDALSAYEAATRLAQQLETRWRRGSPPASDASQCPEADSGIPTGEHAGHAR